MDIFKRVKIQRKLIKTNLFWQQTQNLLNKLNNSNKFLTKSLQIIFIFPLKFANIKMQIIAICVIVIALLSEVIYSSMNLKQSNGKKILINILSK
jgi:hypothetical protein